jgi:hypothetical protein
LLHTLQAQVTDLKEVIAEYGKDNTQKLQVAIMTVRE